MVIICTTHKKNNKRKTQIYFQKMDYGVRSYMTKTRYQFEGWLKKSNLGIVGAMISQGKSPIGCKSYLFGPIHSDIY